MICHKHFYLTLMHCFVMQVQSSFGPKLHVFVCVNVRDDLHRSCCQRVGGEDVAAALKEWTIKENLRDKVWVSKSKCLGFCNPIGATVVVYPVQKWFMQVKKEDVPAVISEVKA